MSIFRILLLVGLVYLFMRYINRQKGRRPIGRKKRVVRSELATARAKFHQIIQYFDPQQEREKLARAFHNLMNARGAETQTDAYHNGMDAIKNIINTREKDVRRINSLDKLKAKYDSTKDTFSDGLRAEIDSHFERADQILANEHFSVAIDELKMISRLLPWLITKGDEGRDNSVHWKSELADSKELLRKKIADERGWFNLI